MKLVIDNTKNQRNNKQLTKPDKETFMSKKTHETKPENWEAIRDKVMELDTEHFQYLLEMERDHCKSVVNEEEPDYDYIGFLSYSAGQLVKVLDLAKDAKTLTKETTNN